MRTLKAIDLSGLGDIRLRTWLLQLAKQVAASSGTINPVTTSPGGTVINNIGLQFTDDPIYGAILNQTSGWSRNRISFRPYTSIGPLIIDTKATKRVFPFVVTSQVFGYICADLQDPSHFWQFRVSPDGIPFCEDLGLTSANTDYTL